MSHFPHVKKVEVEVHKVGPHSFDARVKVRAGSRWLVVKKSGQEVGEALNRAKESMDKKVRREWEKFKNHKALEPQLG